MKRIALMLVLFLTTPVFAEVFFEPEWSEFCPQRYSSINSDRWHYTSTGRYWAERKKNFEARLERCNNLPESSREACYAKLREIENNLSQNYGSDNTNRVLKYMMYKSVF